MRIASGSEARLESAQAVFARKRNFRFRRCHGIGAIVRPGGGSPLRLGDTRWRSHYPGIRAGGLCDGPGGQAHRSAGRETRRERGGPRPGSLPKGDRTRGGPHPNPLPEGEGMNPVQSPCCARDPGFQLPLPLGEGRGEGHCQVRSPLEKVGSRAARQPTSRPRLAHLQLLMARWQWRPSRCGASRLPVLRRRAPGCPPRPRSARAACGRAHRSGFRT